MFRGKSMRLQSLSSTKGGGPLDGNKSKSRLGDSGHGLTKEFNDNELEEIREAFNMFDLDKSGSIESHELKLVMTKLGEQPTDEEIKEMIDMVDQNGDGEIDFNEFKALMSLQRAVGNDDAEERLREAFDMFDADHSGQIDRNELRLLMKKLAQDLTESEISQIMDEADADGDGEISFEEFKDMMWS